MKMLTFGVAALLLPAVSGAQEPVDPNWKPWLGCWELVVENARDAGSRPSPSRRTLQPSRDTARPQIASSPPAAA